MYDKSLEYNSYTQTLIGTKRKTLVDQETGEVIEVNQVTKRAYGQKNFWKVYLLDFLQVLNLIDKEIFKMKFKKVLSLALASILLFSTNIYATEMVKDTYKYYDKKEKVTENIITNPSLLNKIIVEDNLEIPEGYELVEVITTTIENLSNESNNVNEENSQRLFSKWTLKNVTSKEEQGKLIASDYYDGPSNFTNSYETSVSSSYSTKSGISAKALSTELGFSVTDTEKLTKSYTVNVPMGKTINLKVYVNNKKYSFSVYKNDDYKGSGTATKPIGLIFKQYVYNKK